MSMRLGRKKKSQYTHYKTLDYTTAVCWVILRGQQMYTVIQAVHSLLYIVEKCHFFSVVTWKDITKYLQKWGVYYLQKWFNILKKGCNIYKSEGCTHFYEILYMCIYIRICVYHVKYVDHVSPIYSPFRVSHCKWYVNLQVDSFVSVCD